MDERYGIVVLLAILLIAFCIYFMPTIIAFNRGHHYRWIIFGINTLFGLTGVGYLGAFVWAVWPKQTAVIDVVVNDPTTNSQEDGEKIYAKMGKNVHAFNQARDAQVIITPPDLPSSDKNSYEKELRILASLKEDGIITEEEFIKKKKDILDKK